MKLVQSAIEQAQKEYDEKVKNCDERHEIARNELERIHKEQLEEAMESSVQSVFQNIK